MRFLNAASVALMTSASSAFVPHSSSTSISRRSALSRASCASPSVTTTTRLNMANLPFFAQEEKGKSSPTSSSSSSSAVAAQPADDGEEFDSMTMEEEIERLVQKELAKTMRMSKMSNEKGMEYAPWMGISEVDEDRIRSVMREKTEARRKRREQERDVSGNLFRDSQAQELSGTGLSYKIVDGTSVELQWATRTESNTRGFVVKRRAAKTNDYSVVASYAEYGPLVSKGREGGIYRYLDETATPGGWVYRISEVDNNGNESDVCQCLVELETEGEQKAAIIAGVGFGLFALGAFVAGVVMDPMNGY
ncbi:hypothetical protein ACHAXA_001265 [Cyclostephanos tholiformis]|uniref:Uncharacterized protein n=1 Tax=Cyclostephanos tholiformis TaxID=382380 RepID=A0ABD3RVI1_9STRA